MKVSRGDRFMALCWAELSAAFPIAGGDYALVWHSFKGRASWLAGLVSLVALTLCVDFIAFIPAVIALGTGTYLAVIWTVNPKVIGAIPGGAVRAPGVIVPHRPQRSTRAVATDEHQPFVHQVTAPGAPAPGAW